MSEPRREDIELVAATAALARIEIPEAELPALASEFSRILEAFRVLQAVDVAGVEPLLHATELVDVLRADQPRPGLERERVLENAPDRTPEFFRVPKTVGGD